MDVPFLPGAANDDPIIFTSSRIIYIAVMGLVNTIFAGLGASRNDFRQGFEIAGAILYGSLTIVLCIAYCSKNLQTQRRIVHGIMLTFFAFFLAAALVPYLRTAVGEVFIRDSEGKIITISLSLAPIERYIYVLTIFGNLAAIALAIPVASLLQLSKKGISLSVGINTFGIQVLILALCYLWIQIFSLYNPWSVIISVSAVMIPLFINSRLIFQVILHIIIFVHILAGVEIINSWTVSSELKQELEVALCRFATNVCYLSMLAVMGITKLPREE